MFTDLSLALWLVVCFAGGIVMATAIDRYQFPREKTQ